MLYYSVRRAVSERRQGQKARNPDTGCAAAGGGRGCVGRVIDRAAAVARGSGMRGTCST